MNKIFSLPGLVAGMAAGLLAGLLISHFIGWFLMVLGVGIAIVFVAFRMQRGKIQKQARGNLTSFGAGADAALGDVMALMERVSTLIRANLNDLIDKAEHPEKLTN